MTSAVVLSGAGAYGDPWHAFGETSARLAAVLAEEGLEVDVREDVEQALVDLDTDLLVVSSAPGPGAPPAAVEGLRRHLGRGRPLLVVHVALMPFLGWSGWRAVTGGLWVDGRSSHPPIGPAHVVVHRERHPLVAGVPDLDLLDERYCDLELEDDVVALASHEHDGRVHPLVWARAAGSARVVVDALGHDVRSYDAAAHRVLLGRAVRWLLGRLPGEVPGEVLGDATGQAPGEVPGGAMAEPRATAAAHLPDGAPG